MSQAIRKCAQFVTLTAAVLLQAQGADAANVYATIEGVKMGVFKGDSPKQGLENKTEVLNFEYSANVPISPTTGLMTGKRQHGPVMVTKVIGPASPQLLQALVANESLKTVQIDFLGVNPATGQEYLASSIRLGGAKVVRIDQFTEGTGTAADSAKHVAGAGARTLEQISFTFQTIEMTSFDGKTSAMDSLLVQ